MSRVLARLMLVLLIAGLDGASATEGSAPAQRTVSDDHLEITITFRNDTSAERRSHAANRSYAMIAIRNKSTEKITYASGYAELNWSLEWLQMDNRSQPAAGSFGDVPRTAFGTMLQHAPRSRSIDAGVAPRQTDALEADLGRTFDLTLSRRYFVSGFIDYRIGEQQLRLAWQRLELCCD